MSALEQSTRRLVHTLRMPVRWGDMDAFGHVNNTVYFRYMEQTRIEWMASFFDIDSTVDVGPVLVNTQCTFLVPLKYPDQIEVRMFIDSPGRSSLETIYQIYRLDARLDAHSGAEEKLCAEGSGKMVWVDRALEKSAPLPDIIRQQISEA